MTNEQTFAWLLELRRERMRKALGAVASITPQDAWEALGGSTERYDTAKAEQVCALLAGIGFIPGRGDTWTRNA